MISTTNSVDNSEQILDGMREVRAATCDWETNKDQHQPRLLVTYETDYFSSGTTDSKQFDCDIFKTIKYGGDTAIVCPAILPVIKRWQAFVRLYENIERSRKENKKTGRPKRIKHRNRQFYEVAKGLLQRLSPLKLEEAQERALPKEEALFIHVDLFGVDAETDAAGWREECLCLSYIWECMRDTKWRRTIPSREREKLLNAIESEINIRAEAYTSAYRQRSETKAQAGECGNIKSCVKGTEMYRKAADKVLEFLSQDTRYVSLLKRKNYRSLELEYLAWRLNRAKNRLRDYADCRQQRSDLLMELQFKALRSKDPATADWPADPSWDYSFREDFSPEFAFWVDLIRPLTIKGEKCLEVNFYDNVSHRPNRVVLFGA
jgi:hypothetical protein